MSIKDELMGWFKVPDVEKDDNISECKRDTDDKKG